MKNRLRSSNGRLMADVDQLTAALRPHWDSHSNRFVISELWQELQDPNHPGHQFVNWGTEDAERFYQIRQIEHLCMQAERVLRLEITNVPGTVETIDVEITHGEIRAFVESPGVYGLQTPRMRLLKLAGLTGNRVTSLPVMLNNNRAALIELGCESVVLLLEQALAELKSVLDDPDEDSANPEES